jgi:hypothetical protein
MHMLIWRLYCRQHTYAFSIYHEQSSAARCHTSPSVVPSLFLLIRIHIPVGKRTSNKSSTGATRGTPTDWTMSHTQCTA